MAIPYFLRAFRIIIYLKNGDTISVTTDSQAECIFSAEFALLHAYPFCNVVLYNVGRDTSQQIASYGDTVEIHAGYQFNAGDQGAQSLIFKGFVFQPILEKENVVDLKLTLRCYLFLLQDQGNFVSFTLSAGSRPQDAFGEIIKQAGLQIGYVDFTKLGSRQYIAPQSFHGRPTALLSKLAEDSKCLFWLDCFGVNLAQVGFEPGHAPAPQIIFCPPSDGINILPASASSAKPTIIGTPRQTQQGVELVVLMDSQVKIGIPIQLINTYYIQQERTFGGENNKQFPLLTADGIYIVSAVRHYGNTRGGEWYTEIVAVTNLLTGYALQ